MKHVSIDFGSITGKIKPMHAVNNSPFENAWKTGTLKSFAEAGIPFARNHDASFRVEYGGAHAHDVLNIFPNFDADANDPANYDFVLTDKTIQDTEAAGCKMFYRLGTKIEHEIKKYQTHVPKDYKKWAQICEHIIAHMCYGWADGHHFDIPYWEIWNEADGFAASGARSSWQGTMEEFYDFFEVVLKHLKACYPELKIGGPAYTGEPNAWEEMENFIIEAERRQLPLDFFSWHGYSTDPRHYERSVARVKAMLDTHGFGHVELILSEWNYIRGWAFEDMVYSGKVTQSIQGAAYLASSMLVAQKTPMDMFMYYEASPDTRFNGLFAPFSYEPLKGYYSIWQFNKLYRLGNEVLSTGDDADIYVGAATDGTNHAIQLTYYSDTPAEDETVEIRFQGLTGNTEFTTYLVDSDHTNEPIRSDLYTVEAGSLFLKLKANSVVLITNLPIK